MQGNTVSVKRSPPNYAARQRGAILIMTAAFIVAAVALLALVVDTGRLYAAQTKLQSAANLAALDAARVASGCRTNDTMDIYDPDAGKDVAQKAILLNYANSDSTPTLSRYERGEVQAVTDPSKPDHGLRRFSPGNPSIQKPNAVRLSLTDESYRPLFAMFAKDDTVLHASSGAISRPEASLQIGTSLAHINPAILSQLLGVNLDVASLGNLADLNIALADLIRPNVSLLTQADVARIQINQALENVSDQLNGPSRAVVNALQNQLGDQPLSEILSLAGPVGGDVSIALGSVVNAAAQLVAKDRDNVVIFDFDDDNDLLEIPGLGGIDAHLEILDPMSIDVGPAGQNAQGDYYTVAKSAQVAIILDINLHLLAEGATLANVPLVVHVADGRAALTKIQCPTATDRKYLVASHITTATATAGVGTIEDDKFVPGRIELLGNLVTIDNTDENNLSTISSNEYDIDPQFAVSSLDELPLERGPDDSEALNTAQLTSLLSNVSLQAHVGQDLPVIGDLIDGLGDLLGGVVCGLFGCDSPESLLTTDVLLAPINELLDNVLAPVLAPALDPILEQLGVSLSSATVTLNGINGSQPQLFCSSADDCGFEAK